MTDNRSARPELETLEAREVPSVSNVFLSGSTLIVQTNGGNTTANISQVGANYVVRDTVTNQTWSRAAASVSIVEFQGGIGNDDFRDNVSALRCRLFGNGGNDYLEGFSAADQLNGGDGNDTLVGFGGNDTVWGGNGDDVIRGMDGNDQLVGDAGNDKIDGGTGNDTMWGGFGNDTLLGGIGNDQIVGDAGNDHLNGQAGNDTMWGGDGNDVLIAIDNSTGDVMQGNAGRDVFWSDRVFFFSTDNASDVTSSDVLHTVSSFANGADRTLDGDNIADPTLKAGAQYKRFTGPLFSTNGPQVNDIRQGDLGDCYFLAGTGGVALDSSFTLTARIVDFDDGTYGVRMGDKFYRIDGDLPVSNLAATNTAYAKLGAQNSLWVAIAEKAFAMYRTGANSYASIEGGSGVEANRAWGSTTAGLKSFSSYGNATALANDLYNRWAGYQAVSVGIHNYGVFNATNSPLIIHHEYTVMSFQRNAQGVITGITVRNPWGFDGIGNDSNTSDGLITLTPAQLFGLTGTTFYGRV